jgi:hypothetical protein
MVRFLAGGRSVEIQERDARWIALELRKLDGARVMPEGGLDQIPGNSLAAAAAIDHALETGSPVEPEDGEASAIRAVLVYAATSAPLPDALLELRDALAAQLGIASQG